jgi:hypothetical protein
MELDLRSCLFGDDRRGLLLLGVAASGLIEGRLFRAMIAGRLFGWCKLSTGRCADDDGQEAEQRCEEVKSFFHRCEIGRSSVGIGYIRLEIFFCCCDCILK